jgi:LysR family nod box-dependent transcriptional activator
VRQAAVSTPGVQFHFILTDERAAEQLRRGEVDLVVAPSEYDLTGVPTEPLYE